MKFIKTNIVMALVIAIVAIISINLVQTAHADWPTTKALTLPGGGTGTNFVSANYDTGIGQGVYTSFKVTGVEVVLDSAAADVATVTVKRAASGPVYHTATVASNGTLKISFETNDWSFLRGDVMYVNCSATNTGTVTLLGEEK